jgi:hypothetical protein
MLPSGRTSAMICRMELDPTSIAAIRRAAALADLVSGVVTGSTLRMDSLEATARCRGDLTADPTAELLRTNTPSGVRRNGDVTTVTTS